MSRRVKDNGRPVIPQAAPPTEIPAINLYKLTGADLRNYLKLQSSAASGTEREDLGFELLDRAVEGGLEAIPFPLVGAYVKQMLELLEESLNPNA